MKRWLLASLVALAPASAVANDASFGFVGGALELQEEADVSLVAEHLQFTYEGPGVRWRANLRYELHHDGDAPITLQVGLPFRFPDPDSDAYGPGYQDPIEEFVTEVDGVPVAVQQVPEEIPADAMEYDRVYLATVTFEPGQTRVLTHRYVTYGGVDSSGGWWFDYLLTTARSWNGPIGSVAIDFQLPTQRAEGQSPCLRSSLPFERDGDWLRVRLTDFTPSTDFEVSGVRGDDVIAMNYGLDFDATDPERACDSTWGDVDRSAVAAHVSLFYGAPATEARLEAARNIDLCRLAPPHTAGEGDVVSRVGYVARDGWWETIPSALRACLGISEE